MLPNSLSWISRFASRLQHQMHGKAMEKAISSLWISSPTSENAPCTNLHFKDYAKGLLVSLHSHQTCEPCKSLSGTSKTLQKASSSLPTYYIWYQFVITMGTLKLREWPISLEPMWSKMPLLESWQNYLIN